LIATADAVDDEARRPGFMSEDDPVRTALADALRAGREEPQDDLDAVTERVVRELRRRGYEIRGYLRAS
jgi:hypothetical protein